MKPYPLIFRKIAPTLTVAAMLTLAPSLHAASWVGGGGNTHWNNPDNWSDSALPDNQEVIFGDTGTTDKSTPGNIVTVNTTIATLNYVNYGTSSNSWQVTQINEGATLTINGSDAIFRVGYGLHEQNIYHETRVAFVGDGTLQVGTDNNAIAYIGNAAPGKSTTMGSILDLSGLRETVFNLGGGTLNVGAEDRSSATLILSNNTSIIAANLYIGGDTGKNSSGIVRFDTGTSDTKTVVIRGADNTPLNILGIANYTSASTSGRQYGELDLSGAVVDAEVNILVIGRGQNSGANGRSEGVFTMDAGTFVVQTGTIGSARNTSSTSNDPHTGIVNINGGTFLVSGSLTLAAKDNGNARSTGIINISGSGHMVAESGIQMGHRANGTSEEILEATINLTGGSLTVGGDIAKGTGGSAIVSTILLDGGHLDMGGHAITVDSFLVQSGTLSNLGQFNSGATLTKTGAGTLHLAGVSNHTGPTDLTAGTTILSGTLAHSHVMVRNEAVLRADGGVIGQALTIESGGTLAFTLESTTPATFLAAESITLGEEANLELTLATLPATSYHLVQGDVEGTFLTINGQTIVDNRFTLTFNEQLFEFIIDYSNGITITQVIPEPATVVILALGLFPILKGIRRRL